MFPIHTFPISRGAQVGERELSDGSSMTGLVPASETKSEMRRELKRYGTAAEHIWPWVKTVVPKCEHQNRWDLWM